MSLISKEHLGKFLSSALAAVVFSFCEVVGIRISLKYGTSVHSSAAFEAFARAVDAAPLLFGILAWMLAAAVTYGLFGLCARVRRRESGAPKGRIGRFLMETRFLWLFTAGVLLLCWTPYLLGAWPGYFTEDAGSQVPQVFYDEVGYSVWQPLFHTLLMGNLMKIGYDLTGRLAVGVTIYCVFQMVVCALLFGAFIQDIRRLTGRLWVTLAGAAFYAFLPTVAMYVMCTTKDVLCAAFSVEVMLRFWRMLRDEERFFGDPKNIAVFVVCAVLTCLLRNNMIYVFGLMGLCLLLFQGQKRWRRLLLCLGATAIAFLLNKGMMTALEAEPANPREMLSVAFQQLARVYCEEGEDAFTEEELSFLYTVIEPAALGGYNPFLADAVKDQENYTVISTHKGEYVRLWLAKGLQYPLIYAEAFLENTYQSWYPGTCIVTDPDEEVSEYFHYTNGWTFVERTPILPFMDEFCREIAEEFSYQRLPVVRLLFSVGFMLWTAMFTLAFGAAYGDRRLVCSLLFVGIITLSMLFGPCVYVRYYLYLFFGFPVMLGFLAGRENDGEA